MADVVRGRCEGAARTDRSAEALAGVCEGGVALPVDVRCRRALPTLPCPPLPRLRARPARISRAAARTADGRPPASRFGDVSARSGVALAWHHKPQTVDGGASVRGHPPPSVCLGV